MRIFFLILFFMPCVIAWNWDTHEAIITSTYYRLNESLRKTLDLEKLQEGSVMPDKVFQDFSKHGFPEAIDKTNYWLDQTQNFLHRKDYNNASISFGIASHYASDSFAAPHSVAGEPYSLHKWYEDQASQDYLYASCFEQNLALKDIIFTGSQQGRTWKDWLHMHDPTYPQQATQEAAMYFTSLALHFFEDTCHSFKTQIEEVPFTLTITTSLSFSIILLGMGWAGISLYSNLKNYRE